MDSSRGMRAQNDGLLISINSFKETALDKMHGRPQGMKAAMAVLSIPIWIYWSFPLISSVETAVR
jgi:hypothetical protein